MFHAKQTKRVSKSSSEGCVLKLDTILPSLITAWDSGGFPSRVPRRHFQIPIQPSALLAVSINGSWLIHLLGQQ